MVDADRASIGFDGPPGAGSGLGQARSAWLDGSVASGVALTCTAVALVVLVVVRFAQGAPFGLVAPAIAVGAATFWLSRNPLGALVSSAVLLGAVDFLETGFAVSVVVLAAALVTQVRIPGMAALMVPLYPLAGPGAELVVVAAGGLLVVGADLASGTASWRPVVARLASPFSAVGVLVGVVVLVVQDGPLIGFVAGLAAGLVARLLARNPANLGVGRSVAHFGMVAVAAIPAGLLLASAVGRVPQLSNLAVIGGAWAALAFSALVSLEARAIARTYAVSGPHDRLWSTLAISGALAVALVAVQGALRDAYALLFATAAVLAPLLGLLVARAPIPPQAVDAGHEWLAGLRIATFPVILALLAGLMGLAHGLF